MEFAQCTYLTDLAAINVAASVGGHGNITTWLLEPIYIFIISSMGFVEHTLTT